MVSLWHVVDDILITMPNALWTLFLIQDWTGLDFVSIMNDAENIRNTVCNEPAKFSISVWSSVCYYYWCLDFFLISHYWCLDGTRPDCQTCMSTWFMCFEHSMRQGTDWLILLKRIFKLCTKCIFTWMERYHISDQSHERVLLRLVF